MKTKKEKKQEVTEVTEEVKDVERVSELNCAKEIDEVLKKYSCILSPVITLTSKGVSKAQTMVVYVAAEKKSVKPTELE